jgi:hypothetical protein
MDFGFWAGLLILIGVCLCPILTVSILLFMSGNTLLGVLTLIIFIIDASD